MSSSALRLLAIFLALSFGTVRASAQTNSAPIGATVTPTPVAVSLPIDTLDTTVPQGTVLLKPVTTTDIDATLRYVGFQGDFTFDERICSFSSPFVEQAGLTAGNWNVAANILSIPIGPIRILRVSAFSKDFIPLSGSGTLYNLRMLRTGGMPDSNTLLGWQPFPGDFFFIDDDLKSHDTTRINGLITITGPFATPSPTATPGTPSPTPSPAPVTVSLPIDTLDTRVSVDTVVVKAVTTTFVDPDLRYIGFQAEFTFDETVCTFSTPLTVEQAGLTSGNAWYLTATILPGSGPIRTLRIICFSEDGSSGVSLFGTGTLFNLRMLRTSSTPGNNTVLHWEPVPKNFIFIDGDHFPHSATQVDGLVTIITSTPTPTPTFTPTPTPTITPTPTCTSVITQSSSQVIIPGNSTSCHTTIGHTENSYWRAFNMATFTGGAPYTVNSVSFGVESANHPQSVIVRLYANNNGAFPEGTRTLIGERNVNITSAQSGTVVTIPTFASVPAGTGELVMELFTLAVSQNLFYVGSNPDPQTGPSYISAEDCGVPTPRDLATLGFPNMHIVFNVEGTCDVSPSPTPTPTPSPTTTPTPSPTLTPCSSNVVWSGNFDELPAGTPTQCFYISTNNPDTPPNDLFVPDNDGIIDCTYELMTIEIPNASSILRFRNNFDTEFSDGIYWDGGVLEVSSPNITGGNFLDITDSNIGGSFVSGGYTGEISGKANNPLAGRMAWSGSSEGYIDSIINLGPNLAGQTVTFRFRFGSDEAVAAPGWWIDTIDVIEMTGACPTPSPTPPPATPTPSPTPTAGPAQTLNISTRVLVRTGDAVGVGGFIITGTAPKQVILRGIGPSLANFGIPNPLADPVMELHGPSGFITVTNNNWRDTQEAEILATGLAPTNDLESAILATLDPGNYTAVVAGVNNGIGVAVVEIYDLAQGVPSSLGNISTRSYVNTGNDIMIAGFILSGNTEDDTVILRGIGPSLSNFGVPDVLADPNLELRDQSGTLVRSNDNWQDDPIQAAILTATGLALSDPAESGIVATIVPGIYTALLSGVNEGVGNGLVEVYDLRTSGPFPSPSPSGTPTPSPTPTPTITPTPSPTPPGSCVEDWDSVTAPALPPGWVASNDVPGDGTLWVTSPTSPESAPNDAFVADQDGTSDKALYRSNVTINSSSAVFAFRNNFDFEFSDGICFDGYVLEVSSPNISGGDFLDIIDSHVGGSFISGGYTCEIRGDSNPLAGRPAWAASSGGYVDTVINLGPNLAGQTVTFRFRMGTDEAVAAPGVHLDNISITDASCP